MTDSMRAVIARGLEGPDALELAEVPRPRPGIGQVLIRVRAAGTNPVDAMTTRSGLVSGPPPFTPGFDVAGTVVAIGPGVTVRAPGDEVFGMLDFPAADSLGGYAEYAVAHARTVVPIPAGLDHVHAAALPLAGLTAWQALVETAGLEPGQRVLISGASGGVGHLAVQVAAAIGAEVTALASAANADAVRALGAHRVLDGRTAADDDLAGPFDVVLDALGGDFTTRAVSLARPGGAVVSTLPQAIAPAAALAAERDVTIAGLFVEADRGGMEALARLVAEGALRPTIAATHPLEEAATALTARHGMGKVVLVIDPIG
jgi:NADPH:quinone reductase-like Zn-dependent oxidoreductase